jgi:hypothetical protein
MAVTTMINAYSAVWLPVSRPTSRALVVGIENGVVLTGMAVPFRVRPSSGRLEGQGGAELDGVG